MRGTLKILAGDFLDLFMAKDKALRGGGGSFGGGGATGTWGPPQGAKIEDHVSVFDKLGPEVSFGMVGDPMCPSGGEYRRWEYLNFGGDIYGPHPSGYGPVKYGLNSLFNVRGVAAGWDHAEWAQANNRFPFSDVLGWETTPIYYTLPAMPQQGDLGHVDPSTVDPYVTDDDLGLVETAVFPASPINVPGFPLRKYYETQVRGIWEIVREDCFLPELRPVVVRPLDRWAKTSYPYDPSDLGDPKEKPKKDDDGGWFIPPFIFTVPLGPPIAGPPAVGPITGPSGSGGEPPPRQPPKRGERVRKKKGALQRIFKVLDVISESAEVVDCFFDALPKSIKNKWKKDRPNRGLLDTAGQYGIDGADWKAQAIYHNWKSVDINKALECVALNEISDKVVGTIMRVAPPQAGGTLSGLSREFYLAKKKKEAQHWAAVRAANAARSAAFKRKGGKKNGLQKTR